MKTVQSFRITNIEITKDERKEKFTRQFLMQFLASPDQLLGTEFAQCEDTWRGNDDFEIQIFHMGLYESNGQGEHTAQHQAIIMDYDHTEEFGRFDIEIFTDRNGDHVLLECGGCGLILTNGELEGFGDSISTDMTDYRLDCEPGSIIPFGEHFQEDGVNWCGCFHEVAR